MLNGGWEGDRKMWEEEEAAWTWTWTQRHETRCGSFKRRTVSTLPNQGQAHGHGSFQVEELPLM